jgi:hypothetical protein
VRIYKSLVNSSILSINLKVTENCALTIRLNTDPIFDVWFDFDVIVAIGATMLSKWNHRLGVN